MQIMGLREITSMLSVTPSIFIVTACLVDSIRVYGLIICASGAPLGPRWLAAVLLRPTAECYKRTETLVVKKVPYPTHNSLQ